MNFLMHTPQSRERHRAFTVCPLFASTYSISGDLPISPVINMSLQRVIWQTGVLYYGCCGEQEDMILLIVFWVFPINSVWVYELVKIKCLTFKTLLSTIPHFWVCCFCLVTKSCLTVCYSMDCRTPGFLLHYLPEFAHIFMSIDWVSDAI